MNNNTSICNDLVIDREQGLKLAGNKAELANEMLCMFTESLPSDLESIQIACTDKNYTELKKLLHKLLGAVCYCGLPRLKKAIISFENALKQNDLNSCPNLFTELQNEVNLVLEQASEYKS